jgi:hypothetical protein
MIPNEPWYACLPGCEARVPCGQGTHAVRWEAGSLRLPEHPDPEAEAVLAALGGEKARCVELAAAWDRHAGDLSVLAIGPRGPADEITVSWADVAAAGQAGPHVAQATLVRGPPLGPVGPVGPVGPALVRLSGAQRSAMASVAARRQHVQEELEAVRRRRNDMLSLLALGYGFQVRLAGQVAAAHADAPDGAGGRARPALLAALTGRLAPVAERWLGIDPDQVVASLHTGPGWGAVELTGRGEQRRLRVSLPAAWLARVWACGLALAGRHLVVAVERPGWPDARVLGLPAPGAEPVPLDVHDGGDAGNGSGRGGDGAGHAPHWEV